MDTNRIESFKEFGKYLEYPMLVFEAETGKVLQLNYEAEVLLGDSVSLVRLEPGRAIKKMNFWEKLHEKKTIMWQRMRLFADEREYSINGIINETNENGKIIYSLLFEQQTDTSFGGLLLERILNQADTVVVYLRRNEDENFKVDFISKSINLFGYTREQFYDGVVDFSDMVCPEDWEWVEETIEDAVKAHETEMTFSCRIFTEIQELIPVRVNISLIYNDYGSITDLEILIADSREEMKRNSENMHLNHAIAKIKSVVLVKSYHAGKRSLKYISPNAGILGMNVEALNKGYKLSEDYIHPEDRDAVIDTIYQAVANGVTDYTHTYRMVRDDGKQIWVMNEVTATRMSDGEAEISFLLTDITEQKEIEKELAAAREEKKQPEKAEKSESPAFVTIDKGDSVLLEQLQLMATALGQNSEFYTIILDEEGKQMTDPVGPEKDIGQFYDLFERPQFKDNFVGVSAKAKETLLPQHVRFNMEQMQVYIVIAPLVLKDMVTAYWMQTSFSSEGVNQIEKSFDQEWQFVDRVLKSFYSEQIILQEQKLRKRAEHQLDNEIKSRKILREILNDIVTKRENGLGVSCQKACANLRIANIGIFITNEYGHKADAYYTWNSFGEETDFFDIMALTTGEYNLIRGLMKDELYIIADKSTNEPLLQKLLVSTGMEVMLIRSIGVASGEQGYIVFADNKKQRKLDEKDISFITVTSQIFEALLRSNQKMVKAQDVKETFLETYDYIRDAVFVKDNETGNIIFANKAADKLFGYNLVGMQASDIISDQMEQYKELGAVRKRFITNKKVTKWQRYMKELDQIMNIVEVHLDIFNDTDCSLYILKKNKSKK